MAPRTPKATKLPAQIAAEKRAAEKQAEMQRAAENAVAAVQERRNEQLNKKA